ncbi:unnamed protein product [Acanthoscelides obtectus]|uniref:Uncharacterized protein n=1 Tax=Acanthoscelides obtectus TaxID=200917 RepID=A0A9P0PSY5_ACAOB|nr:unnamed protein product [Acanthoscelides obtectus]CAK1638678.1 hypothetical protein AOBTE_LOCUS10752 [Acanthoscelides obtectus]
MSQEKEKEFDSVESILSKLPQKEFRQVWRILYGDGTLYAVCILSRGTYGLE